MWNYFSKRFNKKIQMFHFKSKNGLKRKKASFHKDAFV